MRLASSTDSVNVQSFIHSFVRSFVRSASSNPSLRARGSNIDRQGRVEALPVGALDEALLIDEEVLERKERTCRSGPARSASD